MQKNICQLRTAVVVVFTVLTGSNEVVEEGEQVQDERVPHEIEGGGRPVSVTIFHQVKEGNAIGCNVSERKDRVEDDKESKLEHFDSRHS